MKYTKAMRAADFYRHLGNLGFSYSEANQLRRIEMTLHRWHEKECGTGNDRMTVSIERDKETGKPFERVQMMGRYGWTDRKYPVPDKETGAHKRLAKIMKSHPELWSYIQGDPRGCALYVGRKSDLRFAPGDTLDCQYSRGFAVCI